MRAAWIAAGLVLGGFESSAVAAEPGTEPVRTTSAEGVESTATAEANRPRALEVTDPLLEPVPAPALVLGSWREALGMVKNRSVDLRQALAQVEAARGRARSTLAGSLPKLTGTTTLNHQLIAPQLDPNAPVAGFFPATVFTGRLDLVVPLLSARNWYDYGTELDGIKKSEADVREVERKVIAGVAEALVAVYTAERLAEVSRVGLRSALELLELNRRRLALGTVTQMDIVRLEQEVNRARTQVSSASEALRKSRESLGRALGEPTEVGVTPALSLDQLWQDTAAHCQAVPSLEARSDIVVARQNQALLERRKNAVGYSFLPTIQAQSSLVASTNEFSTGSRGPVGWSIGGVLTWNLYDGGARYGERDQAEANLTQARVQLEGVERNARLEWSQTERGIRVAEDNHRIAGDQARLSKEGLRLVTKKFDAGTATSLELVDAQRASREAELDVAIKDFELLRAKVVAFLARATCDI